MPRKAAVYTYQAESGQRIRLAADSNFWITNLSGDDGLDITLTEQQSTGQIGKSLIGQSVGARTITVTGAIVRDLAASEALLRRIIRPMEAGRWIKTVDGENWYLDVVPQHTPDISGGPNVLNYQFKLRAFYPYWRTVGTDKTLLGGIEATWFPTPVSTAGSFAISRYKQGLYTPVINSGNMETAFVLDLRAAARCKNPMLWHNGRRSYIKLCREMLPGERAVISTQDGERGCTYYAADGTAQNGFYLLDMDSDLWMCLDPGENVLRLTADEGRENLTAIIAAPKGVASNV